MVCTNCGNDNPSEARFCVTCGMAAGSYNPPPAAPQEPAAPQPPTTPQPPTAPQPPAPPPPSAAQQPPAPPQEPAAQPNAQTRIKSAVWIFCAGLLVMLVTVIIAFISFGIIKHAFYLILTPLLPIVLGFGFYLIYKGDVRCRILGFAGLLLFSLGFPIARTLLMMNFQQVSIAPIGFVLTNPVIWGNIGFEFLRCLLLAGVAIGGGTLLREKSKFSIIALIGAIIVLITGLSANWRILRMVIWESIYSGQMPQMIFSQLANAIFFQLVYAGFFMLAVMLAHMFTERNIERMRLSGGARAWCILVYCATGISLIFAIVTGNIPTIFQAILGIPTVVGMIILSTGRRFGFSLALLGVGISVMLSFAQMFPFRPSVVASNIGYVIGGGINPLITWAAISRAWRGKTPPAAVQHTERSS